MAGQEQQPMTQEELDEALYLACLCGSRRGAPGAGWAQTNMS